MKMKLDKFDRRVLKKLDDPSKIGYFVTFAPFVVSDGLRDLCKKYHIKLSDSAVDEISRLIAKKLS